MRRETTPSLKWDETGQIGVVIGPDGQPATPIPPAVLLNMVNSGQIPVIGSISAGDQMVHVWDLHLMDERAYCTRAIEGDTAGGAGCPCLISEPDTRPYCSLNGRERRDPCVFDEPDDAPVWAEIREYVARWGR